MNLLMILRLIYAVLPCICSACSFLWCPIRSMKYLDCLYLVLMISYVSSMGALLKSDTTLKHITSSPSWISSSSINSINVPNANHTFPQIIKPLAFPQNQLSGSDEPVYKPEPNIRYLSWNKKNRIQTGTSVYSTAQPKSQGQSKMS